MASWLKRPRNWMGETKKQSRERRIVALESSVQEAHERLNQAFNEIGELRRKLQFTAGGF